MVERTSHIYTEWCSMISDKILKVGIVSGCQICIEVWNVLSRCGIKYIYYTIFYSYLRGGCVA